LVFAGFFFVSFFRSIPFDMCSSFCGQQIIRSRRPDGVFSRA
jgi:hypothetical protein